MAVAFDSIKYSHGLAAAITKSTRPHPSVAQAFNNWSCFVVSVSSQQVIAMAARSRYNRFQRVCGIASSAPMAS